MDSVNAIHKADYEGFIPPKWTNCPLSVPPELGPKFCAQTALSHVYPHCGR